MDPHSALSRKPTFALLKSQVNFLYEALNNSFMMFCYFILHSCSNCCLDKAVGVEMMSVGCVCFTCILLLSCQLVLLRANKHMFQRPSLAEMLSLPCSLAVFMHASTHRNLFFYLKTERRGSPQVPLLTYVFRQTHCVRASNKLYR